TSALTTSSTLPPPAASYPLSLHDALPILRQRPAIDGSHPASLLDQHRSAAFRCPRTGCARSRPPTRGCVRTSRRDSRWRLALSGDRKSTRLNSSHVKISYAVFCLKKKNIA